MTGRTYRGRAVHGSGRRARSSVRPARGRPAALVLSDIDEVSAGYATTLKADGITVLHHQAP
ncbi:hypothetical protein [Streptomyces sp. MB09-02B]|uniref:hypothetical protein n=1 Tax=Streptomyces sp. MB09-02B TaxID=3028667 RepID=UPI0029A0A826|nr:hypothetical protein [Streptomyces sp. MB09-02B]MDX3645594.1 hypothetical protein [Streptomyces sp. MB09-02B]